MALQGKQGDVEITEACLRELAFLCDAGGNDRHLVVPIPGVLALYHSYRVQHRTVGGRQVREQLRAMHFDVRDNGGTGLSDNNRRAVLPDMLQVGAHCQLRAKADVKDGFDPDVSQPADQFPILSGEVRGNRGSNDGDNRVMLFQGIHELREVVDELTCAMSTRGKAVAASDAHIMDQPDDVAAAVVAVLHRACGNAGMTVDAFLFNDLNHGDKRSCAHGTHLFLSGRARVRN